MAETNYSAVDFSQLSATDDGKTILYKDNQLCQSTSSLKEIIGDISKDKLDTSAFGSVSGTFLTSNDISAADWNDTTDVLRSNSGSWITTTVDNLENYYTKTEVNEEIGKIGSFVTATLTTGEDPHPDISDPSTKIIYLTKDSTSLATDPYTEWIYTSADSSWEIIGETTVDLSDYQTTAAMTAYYTKSETSGKQEIQDALDLKQNILTAGTDLVISNGVISVNTNGTAEGTYAFVEGQSTSAVGDYSHTEGEYTIASGYASHAEGYTTLANESYSHAEGYNTTALGNASHSEGGYTSAAGYESHAEGYGTSAKDYYSHAEGQKTQANSTATHAEGYGTVAAGLYSHAEGQNSQTYNNAAHAEGYNTTAAGNQSHAEGQGTLASTTAAHAEGDSTTAQGYASHAEGVQTSAPNYASHAGGIGTKANHDYTTVIGSYNNVNTAAFIVGNGSVDTHSDAFVVDWNGSVSATSFINADGTIPSFITIATQPANTTACTLYVDANGKFYIVTGTV